MTDTISKTLNDRRAARAEFTLAGYHDADDAANVTDLLADLMHLVSRSPDRYLSFEQHVEQARMHFEAEQD